MDIDQYLSLHPDMLRVALYLREWPDGQGVEDLGDLYAKYDWLAEMLATGIRAWAPVGLIGRQAGLVSILIAHHFLLLHQSELDPSLAGTGGKVRA